MKELKTYISEGFFANVGANDINIIKPAIDTIKDASLNNKINSSIKRQKFVDLLTSILKDVENNMKKGKFAFEYIRDDGVCQNEPVTISFEKSDSNKVKWTHSSKIGNYELSVDYIASNIANDLYYEAKYSSKNPNLRHSIANTIKVTEIKVIL